MLPRRRSTPSISRRAPPASTAPAEAERARSAARAARSAGTSSAERAVHGLAQDAPVDRERADGIAVDGEEAAVHPGHRRAPARHRARPLEARPRARSRGSPPSRPASAVTVDRQDVHAPGAALADDRRPPDARAPRSRSSRRSSSEREPSGSSAACAALGEAGDQQGEDDADTAAHARQGGRPARGCRVASRAAGSSPGCGFRRGRRPARRTGSCPWTCP